MKKVILILSIALCLLAGCGQKNNHIIFVATIESIQVNSIMVTTTDDVGFDKASVGFIKTLKSHST